MSRALPESLSGVLARGWARIHGLVSLEAFGHLVWSRTDVEALLRTEVRSILAELGHPAEAAPQDVTDRKAVWWRHG